MDKVGRLANVASIMAFLFPTLTHAAWSWAWGEDAAADAVNTTAARKEEIKDEHASSLAGAVQVAFVENQIVDFRAKSADAAQ